MIRRKTKLAEFDNSAYRPGSKLKILLWYCINVFFFLNPLIIYSPLKVWLLRAFGATVGHGVVIKPQVNVKYPWFLSIGDHAWIGEKVWIDNLAQVNIKTNVCISQGAMLLTGNHDYKSESFDLIIQPITLEEGAWIGAQSVVCPGVTCGSHSILTVGSVATRNMDDYFIYQGIPAIKIRARKI
jgi:putative colanic acid biosynthesis acetyltransferase WcaF